MFRRRLFQLKNGVVIKGGYPGLGSPDPNARNLSVYQSILSGDLAENDGPDFGNTGDNSYHVVTASSVDATALLDGFTITAGYADGSGDRDRGGGLYNFFSSPTVNNCVFVRNYAAYGGGMCNRGASNPVVRNCTFQGNAADWSGGGVGNYTGSNPEMANCQFTWNSADNYGGGMYTSEGSPRLQSCRFWGNSAGYDGGGIYYYRSTNAIASDCVFTRNSARSGGGVYLDYTSRLVASNCRFNENFSVSDGGAMYCEDSEASLIGCTFNHNRAASDGGGLYNDNSKSVMVNCSFTGNWANGRGGGTYNLGSHSKPPGPVLTNCVFSANVGYYGGAVYMEDHSGSTVTNCTLAHNLAHVGGAMHSNNATQVTICNSILWGNDAYYGAQIALAANSSLSVRYSDVEDGEKGVYVTGASTLNWGLRNITSAPEFVDPNGPDGTIGTEDDNVRILSGSPCIDAADNTSVPTDALDLDGDGNTFERIAVDLDWNPRFVEDPATPDTGNGTPPIADMGAYEYGTGVCGDKAHPYPKGDLDQNCVVDLRDFALFSSQWLETTSP